MKRPVLVPLLLALLAPLAMVGATPAVAESAKVCSGVWVIVDFGELGGITTKCATKFDTGTAALKSAGFTPTLESGMIVKLDGKPSKPDIYKAYWSYWQATRSADGSFSEWKYSDLGANSYHPTKGNAEGWRYQALADGKVKPGATPPSAPVVTPEPTSKPSETAKPSPKPTATKTVTKSPTATATVTKTPSPTATPTATLTGSATDSPSASATPTTPSATPGEPTGWPSAGPGQPEGTVNSPIAPAPSGTPVGALVAGGLVLAGGAGVGAWWWLKGRHR